MEDEFAEVVGQSSLVGFESFLTAVLAAVINSDADGLGELDSEAD
jgi:hypothetical protein